MTQTAIKRDHSESVPPASAAHKLMANALRFLAIDAVEQSKCGHPGMPMGMADVATVLFTQFLKYDAANPAWPDRDRFILSAGHGSMLLYALAHLTGYKAATLDDIRRFRQLGSLAAGHPEHDIARAIEITTGPLGQGISSAVGFALGERIMAARFGGELVDHHTYVIASDGDLMEGVSHEACSLAGHLGLGRLIVLYDDNKISIDGPTSLSFTEDVPARFRAYGWHVQAVDGHDPAAIAAAIAAAKAEAGKPSLIACRTTIGYGAPTKAGTRHAHGEPLGADEAKATRAALNWEHAAFTTPDEAVKAWRDAGHAGHEAFKSWTTRLNAAPNKAAFEAALSGQVPKEVSAALAALKDKLIAEQPKHATRQSSGAVLEAIMPLWSNLIGGSADLTPSNNTQAKSASKAITPADYAGRYIHYGVREHGMAAIMNGLALHGGIVPFGGTFLVFTDYCRPSIRLAALMEQRVVYVMTHDSIGLGEDGPTHQPIEHLASLRAIPNLRVFRPCDGVETAECWELALQSQKAPSLLALSRQGLPTVRDNAATNLSAHGGYVLKPAQGAAAKVVLIATGSEVSLALETQAQLEKAGIPASVVSMPCVELFLAKPADYRQQVLGLESQVLRVAIEAASPMGWDRIVGSQGLICGMTGFGASAPATDLYKHFGLSADAIAQKVRDRLK